MILVRLFIFFGGLIALGLIALLVGPYFIDWSEYREDFQRQASRVLGQKVTVNGDASLRILPFPSVTFDDLTVGENDSGQPMMTVKHFEMDLEITPFLSGEILIFDMRVVEPKLTVTLLKDGTLDWALRSEKQLAGRTLVLENISVTDGKITLVDLQNQRTKRLSDINTTLSAPEISGPWSIDGTASFEGQPFKYLVNTGAPNAEGKIRLRTQLELDALPLILQSEGDAKITDNKPSYDGKFSIAKQPDKNVLNTPAELRNLLSIKSSGQFKANSERLEIPSYRLASGKASDPYVIEGSALVDTGINPEFSIIAKGQQIDVALLSNDQQSEDQSTIAKGFEKLKQITQQMPKPEMPGRVDLSLPAIVAGQTTIRDIKILAEPDANGWVFERFEAKLPGRTNIEAKGKVELGENPSFEGNLLIASQQPSGFSTWLIGRVDPIVRQLGAAGISANTFISKDIQRLENLELILGTSVIKGKAERLNLPDQKPSITFDLAGPEIDLNRLIAVAELANLDKAVDETGGLLSHGIAAKFDTDLMKYGRFTAQNVETVASWNTNRLSIDKLAFENFAGASGNVKGRLEDIFNAPTGQFEFDLKANQAEQLFLLASELTDKHPLIERLRKNARDYSDLDLTGDFSVPSEQDANLSVSGSINGTKVEISAEGPAILGGLTKNETNLLKANLLAENPSSTTLFSQMGFSVLPFDFEENGSFSLEWNGADAEKIDINAELLSGSTTINLNGKMVPDPSLDPSNMTGEFGVSLTSDDIEPLLLTFGQNPPAIGGGQPLNFNAFMKTAPGQITLEALRGDADGNKFDGELNFTTGKRNIEVDGELAFDELDFDWFYQLALGVNWSDLTPEKWSDTAYLPPFDFTPKAELKLSSAKLFNPSLAPIVDFSSDISFGPGEVKFSNVEGNWFGGELLADLSITNPDGNAFASLRGNLVDADLAELSWTNLENGNISGKVEIQAQAEGAGKNLAEAMASMNGGGLYNFSDVRITGFNPDIFDALLKQFDEPETEITTPNIQKSVETFVSDGNYQFKQLSLPFTVTGGQQRIASINLKEDLFEITGDAKFDLSGRTIDAKLNVLHDPLLEVQTGATSELSYTFKGPIQSPKREIDANAMSNFLSIRSYEKERRRVELLQASILENQRLRREISLVKDQQFKREEQARLKAEEEARLKAEEEARIQAEEKQKQLEAEQKRLEEEKRAAELRAQQEAERKQREELEKQRQAQEQSAQQQREQSAIDWQKSVEDALNGSADPLNGDSIIVLPLDAPTSE